MAKRLCALLTVGALAGLAQPILAVTLSGKATPARDSTFALAADEPGQLLLTLFWKRKSARLAVVIVCDNVPLASSLTGDGLFQRLEVGLPQGSICEIGVSSLRGSTKFWLNLQYTGGGVGSLAGQSWAVVATSQSHFPATTALTDYIKRRPVKHP